MEPMNRDEMDEALLATVTTALLIRYGGSVVFTPEEWSEAIERASTMYCYREEADSPVLAVLMPKKAGRA